MTRLVPILLVTVGIALVVGQVHAESEPGAIPLALIVLGLGAHAMMRARHRRIEGR
ncbi:hypothetical protein [Arthrobacter sp. Ld5]|uniref:hypothetical protein n=1 Tax=Arthrobacter sp. Ld5 TaxID=649152 RepID=UPI003EB6A325